MKSLMEENLEPNSEINNETLGNSNTINSNSEEIKEQKLEKNININENKNIPNLLNDSAPKEDKIKENNTPVKNVPKPKKELPIEKKPFQEFVNIHLIPSLTEEIKQRGLEVNNINLSNTNRPISSDRSIGI